jgi:hypothetical protein
MASAVPTPYPVPADEPLRLRDLERHAAIGLASDPHFERLVDLAASLFGTPIVAISLVEAERQWFLASRGLGGGVRDTAQLGLLRPCHRWRRGDGGAGCLPG